MSWKGKLGVMKGGKLKTFLDETMKEAAKYPSPCKYSPIKKIKLRQGKFDKASKYSFLDEV